MRLADSVGRQRRRHAVLVAARARRGAAEAVGERRGAAVVHEGRAPGHAAQRRHLERLARADVDREVVREQRAGVAGRARRRRGPSKSALPRATAAASRPAFAGIAGMVSTHVASASSGPGFSMGPAMRVEKTSFMSAEKSCSSPSQWKGAVAETPPRMRLRAPRARAHEVPDAPVLAALGVAGRAREAAARVDVEDHVPRVGALAGARLTFTPGVGAPEHRGVAHLHDEHPDCE